MKVTLYSDDQKIVTDFPFSENDSTWLESVGANVCIEKHGNMVMMFASVSGTDEEVYQEFFTTENSNKALKEFTERVKNFVHMKGLS